jgi:hypothetical protein
MLAVPDLVRGLGVYVAAGALPPTARPHVTQMINEFEAGPRSMTQQGSHDATRGAVLSRALYRRDDEDKALVA